MRKLFLALVVLAAVGLFSVSSFGQDGTPKVINGGVLNGKAVSLPRPEYPEAAKAAGLAGTVKVQIVIDESGNVESAQAVKEDADNDELSTEKADARTAMREAAERAALEARFSPTLLSGTPVKVKGVIVYNFVDGKIIEGGILNGKAVALPNPSYPAAAKAVAASGTVAVQVTIDEAGEVLSAAAASGHPLLQAAAVDAARHAKFSPTLLSGKPVKVSGVITYKFVLPETKQQ